MLISTPPNSAGLRFVRAEVGSLAMAGGTSDPVLLGGDEMFVPGLPVTVQVVGAVQRPTAVIYQKGRCRSLS